MIKKNIYLITINILAIFIFIFYNINIKLAIIFIIIINTISWTIVHLFKKYKLTLDKKKLETALLDEVLLLSSQPKINDLKQTLQKLSNSNHKIIAKEFTLILKKTEDGHNIKEIFELFSKKYNSEILDRFLELLYNSITTGTVSTKDYHSYASNFLKTKQLFEERKSALLLQKYTIIFAGGFIVPGIIGTVISLTKKLTTTLDLSLISLYQISTNSSLFSVCYYCSIIYIIEYVIISSIYLSFLESDIKKAIVYLIFLLPISIIIFFVGSAIF